MPYSSVSDLPDSVKDKYTQDQLEQFLEVFNSAYDSCIEDDGDSDECESSAFAQAHGVVGDNKENTMAGFIDCPDNRRMVFVADGLPNMLFVPRDNGGNFVWRDDYPAGQLCPYEDCAHDLAIPKGGWYTCGHCERVFFAEDIDSDYEDYHTYRAAEKDDAPASAPVAEDLGESWATPERSTLNRFWKRVLAVFKPEKPPVKTIRTNGNISLGNTSPSHTLDVNDRAASMGDLYQKVDQALWESREDGYPWLHDLYMEEDGGNVYAVYSDNGKLYRTALSYANGVVTLADSEEVVIEHVPVGRSRIVVRQQKDGSYRFFLVAASAVLNRVGEIDSTLLFDNMIEKAENTGEYPEYIFYHAYGNENLRLGQTDFLARDDYLYIASGVFDDTPLANAARAAIEADPEYWGNSIGYKPVGDPDAVELAEGVRVLVYNDGINREISLCPEADAAAYYTRALNLSEEKTMAMSKRAEDALRKLFKDAGQEDLADDFIKENAATNRTIEDENLIRRDGTDDETEEAVEDEPEGDFEIELDDAAMRAIVDEVVKHPTITGLEKTLAEINEALSGMAGGLAESRETFESRMRAIEDELDILVEEEEEYQQQRRVDTPRSRRLVVTTRPKLRHAQDDDEEFEDSSEHVQTVLNSKIANYGPRNPSK